MSDTWIGCESCYLLLQTNHDTACQLLNTVFYVCATVRRIYVPTPMRLLHLVNGWICIILFDSWIHWTILLVCLPAKPVWDIN